MLINRLAILLAERSLSGSRLAVDTGIAQSTISKITSNKSKQVDYTTVNTICNNLKVTPSDFFEYSPIDYDISCVKDEDDSSILIFIKVSKFDTKICTLEFKAVPKYYVNQDQPDFFEESSLSIDKIKKEYTKVDKLIISLEAKNINKEKCDDFYDLPIVFQNILKNDLMEKVGYFLKNEIINVFSDEFTFKKNSFGRVDLLYFNSKATDHRIDIFLGSEISDWAEEELPF
ncbi:TPA: helix-turn-helix domain-containing protein [Streptococcus agalactiae]